VGGFPEDDCDTSGDCEGGTREGVLALVSFFDRNSVSRPFTEPIFFPLPVNPFALPAFVSLSFVCDLTTSVGRLGILRMA